MCNLILLLFNQPFFSCINNMNESEVDHKAPPKDPMDIHGPRGRGGYYQSHGDSLVAPANTIRGISTQQHLPQHISHAVNPMAPMTGLQHGVDSPTASITPIVTPIATPIGTAPNAASPVTAKRQNSMSVYMMGNANKRALGLANAYSQGYLREESREKDSDQVGSLPNQMDPSKLMNQGHNQAQINQGQINQINQAQINQAQIQGQVSQGQINQTLMNQGQIQGQGQINQGLMNEGQIQGINQGVQGRHVQMNQGPNIGQMGLTMLVGNGQIGQSHMTHQSQINQMNQLNQGLMGHSAPYQNYQQPYAYTQGFQGSFQLPRGPLVPPSPNKSNLLELNQLEEHEEEDSGPARPVMSEEEAQLASKLKETYKNIVNYEETVQKHCVELTHKIGQLNGYSGGFGNGGVTGTSELLNELWTVYHHNMVLLDNYNDFLVTALKPLVNQTQLRTGKNIVDLYKIPRRMWVYGVVGFLEVLKNVMGLFAEHEICSCFIAHCFSVVSGLTDPALAMAGWWAEKLGDLLRMAIALYLLKFIDWKVSAEYWYADAMHTMYGHGKIYYHMCTVQQDNLDALVNIGKSVMCRDPFVPTPQYLRLVVENICTQRNILSLLELPIIDFIKIHKVLLSIAGGTTGGATPDAAGTVATPAELQYGIDLITRYGLTFGSDLNGYNFFTRELYTPQGVTTHDTAYGAANLTEKMNFWFNKGPLFALANINHLVGFGDARNPFAKLFLLPEALKERRDKKERKRKARTDDAFEAASCALELSTTEWFSLLAHINKSVLELLMRILKHYLVGPVQASTAHVIVWLYFLLAVSEQTRRVPACGPMFTWLFKKLFPWELLIVYLNKLLGVVRSSTHLRAQCRAQCDVVARHEQQELLPEVWRCWGTLWFDVLAAKGDYVNAEEAGVYSEAMFDVPVCGTIAAGTDPGAPDQKTRLALERDTDERVVRVILVARALAQVQGLGLIRTTSGFRFDEMVYSSSDPDPYGYMEEFLLGDARFVQNSFLQPINAANMATVGEASDEVDIAWFDEPLTPGQEHARQHRLRLSQVHGMYNQDHHTQHQVQHNRALEQMRRSVGYAGTEFSHEYEHGAPFAGFDYEDKMEGDLGERMDTRVSYITLDTNIWLKHCGRVFKCVRHGVLRVAVPLIVFQELRTLRKLLEATIADAATRLVIIIRELYFANEIVPLRFDGTVALDINETFEFENSLNWRLNVDETILNCVHEHDKLGRAQMRGAGREVSLFRNQLVAQQMAAQTLSYHDGLRVLPEHTDVEITQLTPKAAKLFRYCVLITDDRNMRLRAKAMGLTSFQSKWLFSQLETVYSFRCID